MKRATPAIISFILLTLLFEGAARQGLINQALIPAPLTVLHTLNELSTDFAKAFSETLINVLAGLSLSIFIGTLTAFIFSLSDLLRRAVLPFAIFFQTVPIIAIAPLLVIYFGFGSPTVIASSFIVSVFPIIANTLMGLESASGPQKDLFRIYQTSPLKTVLKLKLPSSYPYVYSGLKISAGLAIIGAIAGEFVAGGGLGAMIDAARTQQRVDIVFAALLLLSLMGLFFMGALSLLNRVLLWFRPFAALSQE